MEMSEEEQSWRTEETRPTDSVHTVGTQQVFPQEEAQPTSVFPVGLSRWGLPGPGKNY